MSSVGTFRFHCLQLPRWFLHGADVGEQPPAWLRVAVLVGLHQIVEREAPCGSGARAWPCLPKVVLRVMCVQRAAFWCVWFMPHLDLQKILQGSNRAIPTCWKTEGSIRAFHRLGFIVALGNQ